MVDSLWCHNLLNRNTLGQLEFGFVPSIHRVDNNNTNKITRKSKGQSVTNAAGALYMDGNRMLIIFDSPSVSTLVNLCVNKMWDHKS